MRKLSLLDLANIRIKYESSMTSSEDISLYFGISNNYLRNLASKHAWKRPLSMYRKGVNKKLIPENKIDTTKVLWESGESFNKIARWIGTSENTARNICNEIFGKRNIRLQKQTYYLKRNQQVCLMFNKGSSIEELADYFWLGTKSIKDIINNNIKSVEKFNSSTNIEEQMDLLNEYSIVSETAIKCVCNKYNFPEHYILYNSRGSKSASLYRAIGMYLTHVEASFSLTRTGYLFGRDRTTVAHSCSKVEDMRDDAIFDKEISELSEEFISVLI